MASPFVQTYDDGRVKSVYDHQHAVELMSALSAFADDEDGTSIAVGGSRVGYINSINETDSFTVSLLAGQTYSVSLRGTGGDVALGDTLLRVLNPANGLVGQDDDGGNDTNSLYTFTATATGDYTFVAAAFANPGDPGVGQYTLDVRVRGADAVGQTNATSVAIGQGTTFGFLETGTDVDRYAVTLTAGQYYTFKLAGGADYNTNWLSVPTGELDTILTLRNAAGGIVTTNDDVAFPSDISSALGFFATTSGTYYLDVDAYAPQTGGYVLDFENIDIGTLDPLDAIDWRKSNNVPFQEVDGVPTAYVYFAPAGENFGQTGDSGLTPMVTYGWNAFEQQQVMEALEEFEKILGVNYEVTTNVNQATFRLVTTESQEYGAYFYPQDPQFGQFQGIGGFNILSGGWSLPGQASLQRGGYAFSVVLHEFGHAHGLAHPHDRGGGSDVMLGVTAATGSYGVYDLNQGVYTVMSYNDAWDKHPDGPSAYTRNTVGFGWSATLSAFDIGMLQRRYGIHDYATGDDTYRIADSQAEASYQTIWDTGGEDEIVYDGARDARIDLTAATLDYSPTGGGVLSFILNDPGLTDAQEIKGGYTIAKGVVIENARGGSGDDVLIGNAAANALTGGAGDDMLMGRDGDDALNGGDGNDTLNGGSGADAMTGGLGDDLYYVDTAGDRIVEAVLGGGTDTVSSAISYKLGAGLENLVLTGEAADGVGNGLDNALTGNALGNRLDGEAGDDRLDGAGGDDRLFGGSGEDTLLGGAGADRLDGGSGDDVLNGGAGDDVLAGGSGFDRFVFTDGGADTIVGRQRGEVIDLSGLSGVDASDVRFIRGGVFVENGDDDLTILVSGVAVTMADIVFASAPMGSASAAMVMDVAAFNQMHAVV